MSKTFDIRFQNRFGFQSVRISPSGNPGNKKKSLKIDVDIYTNNGPGELIDYSVIDSPILAEKNRLFNITLRPYGAGYKQIKSEKPIS